MDVMHWLRGLDLERYAPAFHAHNVDVTVLPDLTADDLAGLGVTSIGHRRKLLAAVAVLRAGTIAQAERRQVTIMFCDLVGSTALTSKLDPEDTREIMLHYQGAVSGEVIRFGGFVAKYMGDGVLVYFGYPRAHEDDAERAVRAGLKILAAMKRLRTPADEELQVRIGIATGQVVIGDLIGDGAAQERAVIGDASNIAARLQSSAAPGSIVVAGSTRQLLANLFHLRPLGPQAIKGFSEPIEAWTLAGALVTDTRFEAMRAGTRNAVFVGRKLEAGLLLDRQQQAWQGAGQVVLLSGEPGIGKSRLAAWLCDHITGEPHLLLRFQCSPYHRDSPLHPFAIQIERAADLQADDPSAHKLNKLEAVLAMGLPEPAAAVPPFAALLAIPLSDGCPSPALSPARQRQATFIAILDLIEALARRQPVLLLFEDAHWADATSIELIGLMCERVRALRILAIITFRPEVEPPWPQLPNVTRLVLDRLDQDAVISVVRQVAASRDLPEKMLQALVARADGNPLFAEELTKAALEAETLAGHPANRHVNGLPPQPAVPATLQDSLNDRLDRLTPGKEVAQIGAAIGRDFSYALLSSVAGRDKATLSAALAQLEAAGLVLCSGSASRATYRFKHALIQDAAYEGLLKRKRQILHRCIAEALCDRFPARANAEPEMVAQHFTRASLPGLAVEWWGKAGESALRRGACHEAISHLTKAIELAENLGVGPAQNLLRLRLQVAYGQAVMAAHSYNAPEASAAFLRARELAENVEDASERYAIYYGLWMNAWMRGELCLMEELTAAFLDKAENQPGVPEVSVAHWLAGTTCWCRGDFIAARTHLERARELYNPERDREIAKHFDVAPGVGALTYLALTLWALGELQQAERIFDEALALTESCGNEGSVGYVLLHRSLVAGMQGKFAEGREQTARLLHQARELGNTQYIVWAQGLHGWTTWLAGEHTAGAADMIEARAFRVQHGILAFKPFYDAIHAPVLAMAERMDDALALLDEGERTLERTGERWAESELHRQRGELLLRRAPPDLAGAEAAFRHAVVVAQRQGAKTFELRAVLPLARLLRASGRDAAARKLLASVLAAFEGTSAMPEIARARRLFAVMSEGRPSPMTTDMVLADTALPAAT